MFANTVTPQVIGTIAAGQSYSVSAAGVVSLCSDCNGGGPLTFNPNGTVATLAQGAYAPLNSGPLDHDPSQTTSSPIYYGFYGPSVYLGALYGSFTLTPTGASDLFLIGSGTTIAAGAARTLYGVVNDNSYGDNPGSAFTATLTPIGAAGGVPEPATWAMMLLGFGGLGYTMRHRGRASPRIRFA